MILRCSDRAHSDLLARINLRANDLWRELDAVQLEIECTVVAYGFDRNAYRQLLNRETQILAELDRIDS